MRLLFKKLFTHERMSFKMYLCLAIIFCLNLNKLSSAILVNLPNGSIRGTTNKTLAGQNYHSFLAVRYAQPPIGSLRFQPPKPLEPWEDIYDATKEKHICYQLATNSDLENEDCLFVNVFTPKNLTRKFYYSNLAVLVWIHGGGFVSGAGYISSGFGPKFFMDANVVLVTFNYRLGAFGFLSTGDEVLSGNLGLKDQQMALKWIRNNIKYFGGDSRRVTIFGQSSGGSSVGYHLLNPGSKGLYRAAILQSGSALSPMAYQRNGTHYTYETIKIIDQNFNFTNSINVLSFLQSLPATVIDNAAYNLTINTETPATYQLSKGFFYGPTMETRHNGAFLTEYQYESFLHGNYNRVPTLIGNTNEESLALAKLGDLAFLWNAYDADPSILVPFDMHIIDDDLKKTVGNLIINYFAGTNGFKNDSAKGIKYHSVHDLDKGNVKQAELMARYSRVYFYQFSYSGAMGNNPYKVNGTGNVAHSEELNYLFSRSYNADIPDNSNLTQFSVDDRTTHFRLMALWTNFAKYLTPTPYGIDLKLFQNKKWKPLSRRHFQYLLIDSGLTMKQGYPKPKPYKFWLELYKKYAVLPLDTF